MIRDWEPSATFFDLYGWITLTKYFFDNICKKGLSYQVVRSLEGMIRDLLGLSGVHPHLNCHLDSRQMTRGRWTPQSSNSILMIVAGSFEVNHLGLGLAVKKRQSIANKRTIHLRAQTTIIRSGIRYQFVKGLSVIRKGWRYQIGWIFGKAGKGRGLFLDVFQKKLRYNFPKIMHDIWISFSFEFHGSQDARSRSPDITN